MHVRNDYATALIFRACQSPLISIGQLIGHLTVIDFKKNVIQPEP